MNESDRIFLIDQAQQLIAMDNKPYDEEKILQELIASYPEVLSGDTATPTGGRWVLVGREIAVPTQLGGGGILSLDHLYVDREGVPTFVEVKRSSDTRARREVVAQMLDYAANGSRYWPIEDLKQRWAKQHGLDEEADKSVPGPFGDDFIEEDLWRNVERNLKTGRIRMVFVMDIVPPELRSIIEFLNGQMRDAEIFAIEVKQYVGEGVRTLVPRVIGVTMEAKVAKGAQKASLQELYAAADQAVHDVLQKLMTWSEARGFSSEDKGTATAFTKGGVVIVYLYPGWRAISFNFDILTNAGLESEAQDLLNQLTALSKTVLAPKWPNLSVDDALASWGTFEGILDEYLVKRLTAEEIFGLDPSLTATGEEIQRRSTNNDDPFTFMGRTGGLEAVKLDAMSGDWRNRSYRVSRGKAAANANWFSCSAFVALVNDQQQRTDSPAIGI